jgi:hypothetical protein
MSPAGFSVPLKCGATGASSMRSTSARQLCQRDDQLAQGKKLPDAVSRANAKRQVGAARSLGGAAGNDLHFPVDFDRIAGQSDTIC